MTEIHFINEFWLIVWEIIVPLFLFLFSVKMIFFLKSSIENHFREKEKVRLRQEFIQRFDNSQESLPLTRGQILNSIVYLLKTKASYNIITPSGGYDNASDREVLIEYYQDFFKDLGFE